MFNYLFKNIPAKFIFAGYNVKKGLTVMTTDSENGVYYDVFLYTYIDNHISFFIQMEDGSYKNVDLKLNLPAMDNNDIMSKHLFRGSYYDTREYGEYDKEKIIGVYGLRGFSELLKQIDELEKDNEVKEMSLQALLDEKGAYSGMEIMGAINRFNRNLKGANDYITVPALKKGPNDTFESIIGDEEAWNEFIADKTPDQILAEIKKLDDSVDGVGNIKEDNLNDMLMRK